MPRATVTSSPYNIVTLLHENQLGFLILHYLNHTYALRGTPEVLDYMYSPKENRNSKQCENNGPRIQEYFDIICY